MKIIPGTTDQSVRFTAFDDAGDPVILTAASAGLAIEYRRLLKGIQIGSTALASITNLAFITSPHSDGGLYHYANGEHRIDLPDAAFAAGADEVRIYVIADAITGGVVHGPIWLQAERASQASVDAIKAKTDLLGTAGVTFHAPVASDATVSVRRSRDYHNSDGRALEWTNADGTWPDLTDATFKVLLAEPGKVTAKYVFSGTVVTPAGAGQKVRLELTDTQLAINADDYVYEGKATLASGNVIDLHGVSGPFSVLLGMDEPA